jgi:NAD(P)H-dependent FMN reductase
MKLEIIIASTRPNRLGGQVGEWIAKYAGVSTGFDIQIADLKSINLPFLDEVRQPLSGSYEHEHTKTWSARINAADAFIVVTPEYNFNMPPSLMNAIDYLHHEWKYKPVGFVGYGGTGALRAIQAAKLLFVNLGVMPIQASINLTGVYIPDRMLSELHLWAEALMAMRQSD